jgi:hypothetical protein
MITLDVAQAIIAHGEPIEDHPEDGRGNGHRESHVVCSPKEDYLAVITAYLPSEDEWERDLRTRKTT